MTAPSNIPQNTNFLSPLGFKFTISKTPGVNYFVQSVNIPSVTLGNAEVANPFRRIPFAGDQLEYGDLVITFRVDEELKNYRELYDWIVALGFPESFDQYKSLADVPQTTGAGLYSDASLIVLSSAMNPLMEVSFKNIYPYALTDLQFNTQLLDVQYIDVMANFRFQNLNIKYLT